MKEITIQVDKKNIVFSGLISIGKGIQKAKLASEGKIKSRNAKSFLNEL